MGRTIKILDGKYQFLLKKVGQGVGIAGREVAEIVKKMSDSEFVEFISKVIKISEKRIVEGLRKGLKNCLVAHNSNNLILALFVGVKVNAAGICAGWTDYLKSILTNDKWESLPLNIKTPDKINFKPPLNKSKILLIKQGPNILDEFGNEWN